MLSSQSQSQTEISRSKSNLTSTAAKSALLDRKIEECTAGLPRSFTKQLFSISKDNAATVVNYIEILKTEVNPATNYRKNIVLLLCRFSNYHKNKPFNEISRDDIITFLDSLRKIETLDPLHKWIGTYNLFRNDLFRFFKWLYSPNLDPDKRPKPSVIENIPKLKRKEMSIYKPSDLWTQQDDLLFLKYCPTKREKCYHAISRDTSCRPHEIAKLKLKDIVFKTTGSSQYAETLVNGKTGVRPIPLIDSIPYLKDYLDHEHPQPGNRNAPLICGTRKALGRHLSPLQIFKNYDALKRLKFPKLLESPEVPPEDKLRIRELLKKRWNPYIRRHSALTEKSTILKEHVLRQHAGWSGRSQMHLKYLHYFGNESNESLLEAYGIISSGQQIDQLRPRQCPNCSEPNKVDSKFCSKCRMVLSYDAYSETIEKQKEELAGLEELRAEIRGVKELRAEVRGIKELLNQQK
jgi:integrase/recombinase XerD